MSVHDEKISTGLSTFFSSMNPDVSSSMMRLSTPCSARVGRLSSQGYLIYLHFWLSYQILT